MELELYKGSKYDKVLKKDFVNSSFEKLLGEIVDQTEKYEMALKEIGEELNLLEGKKNAMQKRLQQCKCARNNIADFLNPSKA